MKVINETNNANDIITHLYFSYELLRTGSEIK